MLQTGYFTTDSNVTASVSKGETRGKAYGNALEHISDLIAHQDLPVRRCVIRFRKNMLKGNNGVAIAELVAISDEVINLLPHYGAPGRHHEEVVEEKAPILDEMACIDRRITGRIASSNIQKRLM